MGKLGKIIVLTILISSLGMINIPSASAGSAICGDGICDPAFEDSATCAIDCGTVGGSDSVAVQVTVGGADACGVALSNADFAVSLEPNAFVPDASAIPPTPALTTTATNTGTVLATLEISASNLEDLLNPGISVIDHDRMIFNPADFTNYFILPGGTIPDGTPMPLTSVDPELIVTAAFNPAAPVPLFFGIEAILNQAILPDTVVTGFIEVTAVC